MDDTPVNGNGNSFRKTVMDSPFGLKPLHKAAAIAAWDDCTDPAAYNASSATSSSSIDDELADTESLKRFSSSPSAESAPQALKVHVMESLISSLFSTVSSLKDAYVQLQAAHDPYDAAKLQLADKTVIAEFKKFSELKVSYQSRLSILCSPPEDHAAAAPDSNETTLASYERIINSFQSEVQTKDATIRNLNDVLAHTKTKKEKLERKVKRLEQKLAKDSNRHLPKSDATPSTQLLESAVLGASEASKEFSKLLISLMKTAQWDLNAAANSIEPGINYLRGTHKKFVFESYVSHRMLSGFERLDFDLDGETTLSSQASCGDCFKEYQELKVLDPMAIVISKPECPFAKYCLKKYLELIHPKMEESFFGNLEHRNQISSGVHPHTQFYQSYLKLARSMWMLHKMSFSFERNAQIFEAKRDMDFSPLYMESIVQMVEIDMRTRPKVGFTVMPGFRVENTIIKCQIYITASRL